MIGDEKGSSLTPVFCFATDGKRILFLEDGRRDPGNKPCFETCFSLVVKPGCQRI